MSFTNSKLAAQFQSMEVRNSNFAAFIDVFTSNTYVMVVTSDSTIRKFHIFYFVGWKLNLFFVFSIRSDLDEHEKRSKTFRKTREAERESIFDGRPLIGELRNNFKYHLYKQFLFWYLLNFERKEK